MSFLGFQLALRRSFYGDETHSMPGIENTSYWDILLGKIPDEANNAPLFYLFQKMIVQGFDVHLNSIGSAMEHHRPYNRDDYPYPFLVDPYNRLVLRIGSVFSIALAITAIFYYFTRYHSLFIGFYSVLISLSSYILYHYWAEARPYAFWELLTTLELLLFLHLSKFGYKTKTWGFLTAVHISLACTSIMSIPYLTGLSFILWLTVQRDPRKYILLTFIPCLLAYYFSQILPYGYTTFYFVSSIMDLISAQVPKEYLLMFAAFCLYAGLYYLFGRDLKRKIFNPAVVQDITPVIIMTAGMLASMLAVLFVMSLRPGMNTQAMNRYFVNMTPVGIIAMTFFLAYILKIFEGQKWLRIVALLGITAIIVARMLISLNRVQSLFIG